MFFDFVLQLKIFVFSKINTYKIQSFGVLKNGVYVVMLHTNNIPTIFQSDVFIYGCAMVKNRYLNVMTSPFVNVTFGFSNFGT